MDTILKYMALSLQDKIQTFIKGKKDEIEEIRLRVKRPIVIRTSSKSYVLDHIITTEELLETFQKVCEHSIYSYQSQICEGFITIKGGHRVGITGNCAMENGRVININYISSLNFRIAREKKGSSRHILGHIIEDKNITNTLIASKPGGGKTTVLRDLIRIISSGDEEYDFNPKTCGIVDERGEIASMYKGVPQNDIGIMSDVVDNVSKSQGMKMLIRSMAPEIIACDEIGSIEDIEAIEYAMCSGVKGIFSTHGDSLEEISLNSQIKDLLQKYIIETIVFLDSDNKGKIKKIYKLNKKEKIYNVIFGSK